MMADKFYDSELERDLAKHVDNQIVKLTMDSLDLFKRADIKMAKGAFHISEALMTSAAKLLAGFTTIPPDKAGLLFKNMVEMYQKDAREFVAEQQAKLRKH
jgi:hypothetical protein